MLKVTNLTVYSKRNNLITYLLKDITFSLNKGESLGIIGKSGSGKSTLAKALIEIYDNNVYLESGKIYLDNMLFDTSCRGKKISLLFQNPNSYLNPLMKVGKQIEEMLVYHYKEDKKSAKQKTVSLMEKMGIDNASKIYDYYPYEISGGMQQKVCLCISLICNPDILILDESTSYLDKDSKKSILRLIREVQKEYGFSLIMISHDFKEIYDMCDKIAIMRNGQMIEFGNKKEIILNPLHPHTIELLYTYLSYYKDIDVFTCPLMKIETLKEAPLVMFSETHYVRSWYFNDNAIKIKMPNNISKIKEEVYAHLNNK